MTASAPSKCSSKSKCDRFSETPGEKWPYLLLASVHELKGQIVPCVTLQCFEMMTWHVVSLANSNLIICCSAGGSRGDRVEVHPWGCVQVPSAQKLVLLLPGDWQPGEITYPAAFQATQCNPVL